MEHAEAVDELQKKNLTLSQQLDSAQQEAKACENKLDKANLEIQELKTKNETQN